MSGSSEVQVLIATRRLRKGSRPSYTTPKPPVPICPTMAYLPMRSMAVEQIVAAAKDGRASGPRRGRCGAPRSAAFAQQDLHAVGIVGLEEQGAVGTAAQAPGHVLVAEEQLLVGALGGGHRPGEHQLVLGALVVVRLVVAVRAARPAVHLDRSRPGLVEGPAPLLVVPALQAGQRQNLAVEAAGAVEVLRLEHDAELADLHPVTLPDRGAAYRPRRAAGSRAYAGGSTRAGA